MIIANFVAFRVESVEWRPMALGPDRFAVRSDRNHPRPLFLHLVAHRSPRPKKS
jgi:hypothetical protein